MVQLEEVPDEELYAQQPGEKEDEDDWDTDSGTYTSPLPSPPPPTISNKILGME